MIVKIVGAIISAVFPIITTYFAALTTTALAEAYAGNAAAGQQALWFVVITALLGVMMTAGQTDRRYINQLVRYKIDIAISTTQMYEQFLTWNSGVMTTKTADLYDKAQQLRSFCLHLIHLRQL